MTAAPQRGKGARLSNRPQHFQGISPLANPELGSKQLCPNCQAKFYDLTKRPAHCPKCENEFDPDEAVRNRRVRARAVTPELDEVIDDPALAADDDDDEDAEPAPAVSEDLGEFTDEEEAEDDADVPFLEEDEDDEFDETEIEGLPGEGEDDR